MRRQIPQASSTFSRPRPTALQSDPSGGGWGPSQTERLVSSTPARMKNRVVATTPRGFATALDTAFHYSVGLEWRFRAWRSRWLDDTGAGRRAPPGRTFADPRAGIAGGTLVTPGYARGREPDRLPGSLRRAAGPGRDLRLADRAGRRA